MNRVIKFRAWDADRNAMLQVHSMFLGIGGRGKDETGCYFNHSSDEIAISIPDKAPLMQFTGLTDKNGKDVYEGDVLVTRTHKTTNAVVQYVAEWGRWMACARQVETGKNFVEGAGVFKNREVIGNIYENPELLKV